MNDHQRERHPYSWYQARPPYLAPGEQKVHDDAATRAWLALRLATTPDAWGGLMLQLPVAATALDADELARQTRTAVL